MATDPKHKKDPPPRPQPIRPSKDGGNPNPPQEPGKHGKPKGT